MLGLASGASVGGYAMIRGYVTLAVLAALMSTLAVVRHTRQNEELGRAEMVGAAVVGRYAELAAAVLVASVANLVLAVLIGLADGRRTVSRGPGRSPPARRVAAVGLAFVGRRGGDLRSSPRPRAAPSGWPARSSARRSSLSGIGNMLGTVDATARASPAPGRRGSPRSAGVSRCGRSAGTTGGRSRCSSRCFAVLVLAAVVLAGRRDLGRGVLAERGARRRRSPGSAQPARAGLAPAAGRPARLGGRRLLGFGLVFGAMSEQIQDVTGSAGRVVHPHGRLATGSWTPTAPRSSQMAGMAVAIYVVQMLLRLRVDETGGTLESVLATGVSRPRWLLGHALDALGASSWWWSSA